MSLPAVPVIHFRRFDLDADTPVLHRWVNLPYARFWGMQGRSLEQVRARYAEMQAEPGMGLWMGEFRETPDAPEPLFLLEAYPTAGDVLAKHYKAQPGDLAYHILIGPAEHPMPGLTLRIFEALYEHMFTDPNVSRIVGDPDLSNTKVLRRVYQSGARFGRVMHMPDKVAQNTLLTRERFEAVKRSGPLASPPWTWTASLALKRTWHTGVDRVRRRLQRLLKTSAGA